MHREFPVHPCESGAPLGRGEGQGGGGYADAVHEVALSQQLARMVTRAASGRRVVAVHVEVGHLRQVVPEALHHAWRATTQRTPLASARLVTTAIPAVVRCGSCGADTTLADEPRFDCSACGGTRTTVVAGEEFRLTAIDVDDENEG